ncbi:unnamed protein product [Eretmochelys imbricata]
MPQIWKGVVADKAYLEKAMGYFRAKYQEPVFVVTSNGMEWCRENIDASRETCISRGTEGVLAWERFRSLGSLQPHNHDHRELRHLGQLPGWGGDHLLGQLHPPRLPLPRDLQACSHFPA